MKRAIRASLRAGTAVEFATFYNDRLRVPKSSRIVVVEAEGVVVGIGGVAPDEDSNLIAFVDCGRRWMPPPVVATRLARRVLDEVCPEGGAVYALPSPKIPTAKRWLSLIGFRSVGPETWEWRRVTKEDTDG